MYQNGGQKYHVTNVDLLSNGSADITTRESGIINVSQNDLLLYNGTKPR